MTYLWSFFFFVVICFSLCGSSSASGSHSNVYIPPSTTNTTDIGWVLGVAFNVLGSITDNCGVTLQKYSHNIDGITPPLCNRPYYLRPRWLLGLCLFGLGNALNAVGLYFAAASLIGALSAVAIVVNAINSKLVHKEAFTKRIALGTLFIIAGGIIAVIFGNHDDSDPKNASYILNLFLDTSFIIYSVIIIIIMLILFLFIKWYDRYRRSQESESVFAIVSSSDFPSQTRPTEYEDTLMKTQGEHAFRFVSSPNASLSRTPSLMDSLLGSNLKPRRRSLSPTLSPLRHEEDNIDSPLSPTRLIVHRRVSSANDSAMKTVLFTASIHTATAVACKSPPLHDAVGNQSTPLLSSSPHVLIAYLPKANRLFPLAYPTMAGLMGGFTLLLAKTSELFIKLALKPGGEDENVFTRSPYVAPYLLICATLASAVLQIHWLNRGLQRHDQVQVVPTFYVFYTTACILSGAFFFKEMNTMSSLDISMFVLGACVGVVGVCIISTEKKMNQKPEIVVTNPHPDVEAAIVGEITRRSSVSTHGLFNNIDEGFAINSVNKSLQAESQYKKLVNESAVIESESNKIT